MRWRYNHSMSIRLPILFLAVCAFASATAKAADADNPLIGLRIIEAAPGTFLIAKRSLLDPTFSKSVVYIAEHDATGSVGLIVNQPSSFQLSDAMPDLDKDQAATHRLYFGGPVEISGILMLLRSDTPSEGMRFVADDVYLSADQRVLDKVMDKDSQLTPRQVRFYAGYSGWGAGQLDFELARDSWFVIKADPDLLFSGDQITLWDDLIEQLDPSGIQVHRGPFPEDALSDRYDLFAASLE